ncbi:hypothetical protein Dimus_006240 [Dionaea muscipula]
MPPSTPYQIPQYLTRDDCVDGAWLTKDANRYQDMIKFVDHLVTLLGTQGRPLYYYEAMLLADAYKTVHSSLRESRQALMQDEDVVSEFFREGSPSKHVLAVRSYREKIIEPEMIDLCERFINMLDVHLIPSAVSWTVKVIYLSLLGDFHRYVAEVLVRNRSLAAREARLAYKQAQEIARDHLKPTDDERLFLALKFSTLYKLMNQPVKACLIIKKAFHEARNYVEMDLKRRYDEKLWKIMLIMWEKLEALNPHV